MRTDFIREAIAQEIFMLHPKAMLGLEAFANNNANIEIRGTQQEADNSVVSKIINNVGIISIEGAMYKKSTINMCMSVLSYGDIKNQIIAMEKNEKIDTVVYLVDTPGGVVCDGADDVANMILNSQKKTIAIAKNMMASGGMWIFSACDEIYASSNLAEFGSIGVKGGYLEQKDDKKIYRAVSRNAENKDCTLNGKCKEKLDSQLNTIEDEFFERLKINTGKDKDFFVKEFNKGDTIYAPKALAIGFIKGIVSTDNFIQTLVANAETVPAMTKPVAINQKKESVMAGEQEQDLVAIERARTANIAALGSKYGVSAEAIQSAITDGTEVSAFQTVCLSAMESKLEAQATQSEATINDLKSRLEAAIQNESSDAEATVEYEEEKKVSKEDKQAQALIEAAKNVRV